MENRKLKTTSLDVLVDKNIGKVGTEKAMRINTNYNLT